MASRRAPKAAAPGTAVHDDPEAVATSASHARRNASFSSAPCQTVPQTGPARQPSRKGSASSAVP